MSDKGSTSSNRVDDNMGGGKVLGEPISPSWLPYLFAFEEKGHFGITGLSRIEMAKNYFYISVEKCLTKNMVRMTILRYFDNYVGAGTY